MDPFTASYSQAIYHIHPIVIDHELQCILAYQNPHLANQFLVIQCYSIIISNTVVNDLVIKSRNNTTLALAIYTL